MPKSIKALLISLLYVCSFFIHAAEPPKVTTAELKENLEEETSYWELDLGLMLNYHRSNIKGINDNENGDLNLGLLVSGGYYYKDFFVETHPLIGRPFTIGYTLQRTKRFTVSLIAESVFQGFDEDSQDSGDYLTGINERKSSWDLGIEATYSNKRGESRLRVMHDVANTHNGYMVAFDYAYPIFHKRWIFWPSYGVAWISDDATDYYFGINADEVKPNREAYTAPSSFTHKLSLYTSYQYNTHLSFLAHGAYAIFSNGINDSPIVRPNDDSFVFGVGVMWSF